MSVPTGFVRARKSRPCTICGKPDWCLIAEDGSSVICARVASNRPCGEAGWKHDLRVTDGQPVKLPEWSAARRAELAKAHAEARQAELQARAALDFPALARRFAAAMTPTDARLLADALGLTVGSLRDAQAGVARDYVMTRRPDEHGIRRVARINAWTFPTRNARDVVNGIRFRYFDGKKGGHCYSDMAAGLFIPRDTRAIFRPGWTLYLPEGPTSCAAMRGVRLSAIGRPNNRLGGRELTSLCRQWCPGRICIVAENDAKENGVWPGRDGAEEMRRELSLVCPDTRIVFPPDGVKDVRDWINAGATAWDINERFELAGWANSAGLGVSHA